MGIHTIEGEEEENEKGKKNFLRLTEYWHCVAWREGVVLTSIIVSAEEAPLPENHQAFVALLSVDNCGQL